MPTKKTKKPVTPKKSTRAKPPKAVPKADQPPDVAPTRLSTLSLPELRAKYEEVVQRETGSDNRNYLIWKIREAQAGRVRVGPPLKRAAAGPQQVLSLRVEADAVPLLDAAWRKHGMASRMDLVRQGIQLKLEAIGEPELAARFAT
jgi:hypothetical protein